MSIHRDTSSSALAEINQFIRPNKTLTCIDFASDAERLVLKGASFATSNEVAAAIREGVANKLANAVMATLRNRFESLSDEDNCILADLYTIALSAGTMVTNAVVEPKGPNILANRE